LVCKDIGIRKSEFVADLNPLLNSHPWK